jgi:hypothetical protein
LSALPLLTQFEVSPSLEGNRYLYLPAVGLALGLSGAFGPGRLGRRDVVPAIVLALLLGFYGRALISERAVWMEAAAARDALLSSAAAAALAVPCRTLTVLDAPDNIRGAFVFREGLTEALDPLPTNPGGRECVFRWDGAGLVALAGS